jgi:hypothetical protein
MTAKDKLVSVLISRKFWAAIFGIVVIVVGDRANVDAEQLAGAVALLAAYILGTGIEDGLSRR